ncbi:MAG: indolepyruvate oxidoreductase subunit beta [Acidobacteriota bacterium]
MKTIIIAGVGGQGVLTASNLISDVLLEAGYSVKKSEVHGMSQRGGDVIATIKFGKEVFSPLPSINKTDYILAFEKLEGLRNINFLNEKGKMIVNDFIWEPLPVASGYEKYPEDIRENLEKFSDELVMIPATDLAEELGNVKVTNVVLVGVLASKMEIEKELWLKVITEKVPPKFKDLNISAFEKGYKYK